MVCLIFTVVRKDGKCNVERNFELGPEELCVLYKHGDYCTSTQNVSMNLLISRKQIQYC